MVEDAAKGSPVSPIVYNLHIEFFKDKALRTSQIPPRLWKRFVDDRSVIQCTGHKENFLQHINRTHRAIKFTVEDMRSDGLMPFHDTLIIPNIMEHLAPGYTESLHIQISIYNRTAATIWGLKFSVINTLDLRAKTLSSTIEHLRTEVEQSMELLTKCKYPL